MPNLSSKPIFHFDPTLRDHHWRVILNGRRAGKTERISETIHGGIDASKQTEPVSAIDVLRMIADHLEAESSELAEVDSFQITLFPQQAELPSEKEKTIKEWLEMAITEGISIRNRGGSPNRWGGRALELAIRFKSTEALASSLSDGLLKAFCWDDSSEGQDYWKAIYDRLRKEGR